jgi:hypothetical protein
MHSVHTNVCNVIEGNLRWRAELYAVSCVQEVVGGGGAVGGWWKMSSRQKEESLERCLSLHPWDIFPWPQYSTAAILACMKSNVAALFGLCPETCLISNTQHPIKNNP